ncbi:MAG: Na+:solute symporter [Candidatus Aminicenantes bacterium]|nr:Na+:solute symporter [Candidatus Aminicenantes bacterium]
MLLQGIDWTLIAAYFVISLLIGVAVTRKAGKSSTEFFAAGRNMPWWLLGVSMVATTFSTDTPNLVTDIVRRHGVAGNWFWWAFLLTGMLTVFVYARLWKRSGVLTDIEFYELRYSCRPAAFLRGFRALYLGAFFNIVIMATVSLAAIKIGRVLMNFSPLQTIFIAGLVTMVYSSLGGLRGVLITDLIQFGLAMAGGLGAALVALRLPQVGGLKGLLAHEAVSGRLALLPDFSVGSELFAVFLIPLLVQWWSVWYPGAEPGGGGYIAQRMLAAKNEKHSVGAVFLFNAAHYALRPWPWIIVALASLVVFPNLDALRTAFPHAADVVNHDMGYPAMLTFLPAGFLGLVVASLIAAYMSTISTHLNWGASYLIHDFYHRFLRPQAHEKELVFVGRMATVLLMLLAGVLALWMENALDSFQILLQIGAGTGLLFILRWFWWRINAASEIAAMVVSFLVAVYFRLIHDHTGLPQLDQWQELTIGVCITTFGWLCVTFLTKPTEEKTLVSFCRLVKPGGPGWSKITGRLRGPDESSESGDKAWQVPRGLLCMFLGCSAVYSTLFAVGHWIYGHRTVAMILSAIALVSSMLLVKAWSKLLAD